MLECLFAGSFGGTQKFLEINPEIQILLKSTQSSIQTKDNTNKILIRVNFFDVDLVVVLVELAEAHDARCEPQDVVDAGKSTMLPRLAGEEDGAEPLDGATG